MTPRHLFVCLFLLLAAVTPWDTSDAAVVSTQVSRLCRLAEQEQAILEQRGAILKDASLSGYLQEVTERLWAQVPSHLGMPTVKIIVDSRIYAHSYPNGVCFLSTGMLDVLENESQLSMILAHEMVHYARQHALALYNHFQPTRLQNDGQETNVSRSSIRLATLDAIDAAERQADREGLAILQAAGYCDKEVLSLMANLVHCTLNQEYSESVSQLEKRAERFKVLVKQEAESLTDSVMAGTDGGGYRDSVAPALIANAEHALRRGDWSRAERSITRYLESEPLNARAYYLKGEILRRQNGSRPDAECIGTYEKALEIDPSFPLAHRALGEVHYKAGRYHMAKSYFETFLNLAPENAASDFIKGYLKQCQN